MFSERMSPKRHKSVSISDNNTYIVPLTVHFIVEWNELYEWDVWCQIARWTGQQLLKASSFNQRVCDRWAPLAVRYRSDIDNDDIEQDFKETTPQFDSSSSLSLGEWLSEWVSEWVNEYWRRHSVGDACHVLGSHYITFISPSGCVCVCVCFLIVLCTVWPWCLL